MAFLFGILVFVSFIYNVSVAFKLDGWGKRIFIILGSLLIPICFALSLLFLITGTGKRGRA